ncbi:WhiB family transcriptional regulator [Nocardia cyriacigeorgica]|uniref:WhiB family transcriptional regulator n=1 Tax=Nocardia cyriacigeorgica TaxID=135487 RepID=UPI001893CFEB|nr:WhiB family transcriptional regulator [Nocardia cyriacigeorgica]MBF6162998.1 WhiB family transcriptional regulator [Nocardia cyriacigeorgica]MBF6201977.1 WhiB family transcriptional regulator [Nocardia cyriacigeorgica]
MSSETVMDPAHFALRACNGVDTEVFFPKPGCTTRYEQPLAICAGCPVLASCAAWAAPQIESGDLTGCVVAGVWVPPANRGNRNRRREIAAGLRARAERAGREVAA